MNKSYFYLDMKTHELVVPYTKQKRRVRVLLPKNYEQDTKKTYPVSIFTMDKMSSIARSLSVGILGK